VNQRQAKCMRSSFHQLVLAGNAVQITQKQNAQQELGIPTVRAYMDARFFTFNPGRRKITFEIIAGS